MTYYETIKEICSEKHTTIGNLERTLGFSNGYMKKQKDNINIDRLRQIADYLEVTPKYIVKRKGSTEWEKLVMEVNTFANNKKAKASNDSDFVVKLSEDEYLIIEAFRRMNTADKMKLYADMTNKTED